MNRDFVRTWGEMKRRMREMFVGRDYEQECAIVL